MKKVITAATGFPGRPMKGVFFTFPNANGLPGLIDSLQNSICALFSKNFPILSVLLFEIPPLVTITSRDLILLKINFIR